mmetsp:Transcript_26286/g.26202  ORF Transcript_26286/g.26202 Transcript_26286/m.26202 type:complete len:110 (+) Transcript_26286:90-419(+)
MEDSEFDNYIRSPQKRREQHQSKELNERLISEEKQRLQQLSGTGDITDEYLDEKIINLARREASQFMLQRYAREWQINRVILQNNVSRGDSLDDCDEGCYDHGICRNFT